MGYNIRTVRESMGMTQEQLSEKSSVSRAIISGLESGTITVTTTKTLEKIANAMGVKVSSIFFDD
jgi:transcriptional regulator with XRE-family HTH domain